jgi:hypothetical protein
MKFFENSQLNSKFNQIITSLIIFIALLTFIIYILCFYNIIIAENYKIVLNLFLTKNSNLDSILFFISISFPLIISYLYFGSISHGINKLFVNSFYVAFIFLYYQFFKI